MSGHTVQALGTLRIAGHKVTVVATFAGARARCRGLALKACDHLIESDDGVRLERAYAWFVACLDSEEGLPTLDELPEGGDFDVERGLVELLDALQAQVRRAIQ